MKLIWFFPPALFIVVALFLFMAQLANPGTRYVTADNASVRFDMFRMRFDSDLQVRDRQLPPPPELEVQPPVSHPAVNSPVTKMELPTLDMPDMAMDMAFELTPPSIPNLAPPSDVMTDISIAKTQIPKKRIEPQYPRRAIQRNMEGHVIVEYQVTKEGRVDVSTIKVIEAKPKGVFERVVRKAMARWRYNPMMRDGQAVAFKQRQRFDFSLDK